MRRYVFRLAMFTLFLAGPLAVRGDDQEIAQQIVQKLKAEKQSGALKGFSIDLQVDEGTVWLSGRVNHADQQAKALDIARRVPGVVQVVNDLAVSAPPPSPVKIQSAAAVPTAVVAAKLLPPTPAPDLASDAPAAVQHPEDSPKPARLKPVASQDELASTTRAAIGSGVNENAVANSYQGVIQTAQPVAGVPQPLPGLAALPQALPMGQQMTVAMPYAMVPVYAHPPQPQVPLAYAPAQTVNYNGPAGGVQGSPAPMYLPGSGVGIAPARYDHPQMPGYAWPSYAAHPNYAAVTYPKQYSPTAWPYIGPFYPYPQVPLGWRKVTMEWDDGWWVLDFKDRRTMYNK